MNRRKFIRRISNGAVSLTVPTSSFAIHKSESYRPVQTSYTRNLSFSAVPGSENYPGTPRDQKGLYMNEEHIFWPKLREVIKWQTSANPYKAEKKPIPAVYQLFRGTPWTNYQITLLPGWGTPPT